MFRDLWTAPLALMLAAGITLSGAAAQPAVPMDNAAGPRFRADGPEAAAYGQAAGYPACPGLAYLRDQACRVWAFSNFGALFPSREVAAGGFVSGLTRAPAEPPITYRIDRIERTLDDYLNRQPITGLLIAQGDTILVERYQYGRTDQDRLTSFSMAKTILGLLVGIAIDTGAIGSIDDRADAYVLELRGTEYGRTTIKALLQMASGIEFSEVYTDPSSDIYALARSTIEQGAGGALDAVRRLNVRRAEPGTRFSYSSADSVVLGLVLSRATRRTVADYASEKLWRPLGTEASASWNVDAAGHEVTFAYFNATLRDWARLGLMLAHRGTWHGACIVPGAWLDAAVGRGPNTLVPTYGYHVWLAPDDPDVFVLSGLRGQYVLVDPNSRLVLVQTALNFNEFAVGELMQMWRAIQAQLR